MGLLEIIVEVLLLIRWKKIAVDGPIEELWYISVVYKALISTLPINGKSSCLSDRVLHSFQV